MPQSTYYLIEVSDKFTLEGVDIPMFVLSYGQHDSVQWKNNTNMKCRLDFGKKPFLKKYPTIDIPPKGTSAEYDAHDEGDAPTSADPPGQVYKHYKYSIYFNDNLFCDPGGGIKP